MKKRALSLVLSAVCATGCGSTTPRSAELPVCTKTLPPTATASFSGDTGACTEVTTSLLHHAAADIVPDGYLALGPAVLVEGHPGPFPHGVDLVVPADLGKAAAGAPSTRIVILAKRAGDPAAAIFPASNITFEKDWNRLHFHVAALGTYQAAIPKTAGTHLLRHYTYRALGGVSMGGMGASLNGLRHPDRYDAVAVMGADPGPDLTYSLGMLKDLAFSGFCSAESGKLGQLCPNARKLLVDQYEEPMDFEHLNYQKGAGVGLTLRRSTYMHAMRDLVRGLGNPSYASDAQHPSPGSLYLPPGVPLSSLAQSPADACAHPTVLQRFFDAKYNPDGSHDVITFCDGGDSDANGLGIFDPSMPQLNPVQILLAVDVNKNGKRDSGEPVLLQGAENFQDVGVDGLPDAKEPGYDPVKNPDPNHDDYHWAWNPKGTENNVRWDAGEPFDDFGVDGVKGAGCPVGSAAGCYDLGEGNGTYDYTPGTNRWLARDPHTLLETLSDDTLARVDTWFDAGIRDFLNAEVSTNSLVGVMQARGQHVRVWEGFTSMLGLSPLDDSKIDVGKIEYGPLGRHVYVRYGNPDLSEADVESSGDGRHVGGYSQVVNRVQLLFYFLSHVFPKGDVDPNVGSAQEVKTSFVAKNGRMTHYVAILPPGYNDAGNKSLRYPVVYLLHGLGQKPEDLAALSAFTQLAMSSDAVDDAHRMQKMIIVFPDGVCRPGGDVNSAPLPPDGDLCEGGNFFADHADGTEQGEAQLIELQDLVDATYRTKKAEDIDIVQ